MYILLFVAKEETIVFKSGNSVAVRLKGTCRLPKGTRVREYRDGDRIILEPISGWPRKFIETLGGWDEEIERPKDKKPPRDPFA